MQTAIKKLFQGIIFIHLTKLDRLLFHLTTFQPHLLCLYIFFGTRSLTFHIIMIQVLKRLANIERKRYANKGAVNIVVALVLLFGIMGLSHSVSRQLWPEQIENKMQFVLVGSMAINIIIETIGFLLYVPGYFGWSQSFQQHLSNKKSSRPWDRPTWTKMRTNIIQNLILNQLILYPILVYLTNRQGISLRFTDFPAFSEFSLQILFLYYFDDFVFYWWHRCFHHYPFLYKMHKIHHEYDTLYTWVAQFGHPGDYVFGNLVPSAIPLIVIGNQMHCFVFFYWLCWKILIGCQGHSGYHFAWSPVRIFPLIGDASHHDHHHSHNLGNFGASSYVWDVVFDTYVPYTKDY